MGRPCPPTPHCGQLGDHQLFTFQTVLFNHPEPDAPFLLFWRNESDGDRIAEREVVVVLVDRLVNVARLHGVADIQAVANFVECPLIYLSANLRREILLFHRLVDVAAGSAGVGTSMMTELWRQS